MAPRVAQLGTVGDKHLEHDGDRRGEVRGAIARALPRWLPSRDLTVAACCSPLRSPLGASVSRDGRLTAMATPSIHYDAAEWPTLPSAKEDRCVRL